MIPKTITAPIQWWAKHPWMVFWGLTPIVLSIIIPTSDALLNFVLLLSVIAWILSWFQGMSVTWERSKVRAVLAFPASAITIIILSTITIMMDIDDKSHRKYDYYVKNNLKYAATAQEDYFFDHKTFTSNIGNLKGFNQRHQVNITMEATTTTYVSTGTMTGGWCKANTGTWSYNSKDGIFSGTRCRRSWFERLQYFYNLYIRAF